MEILPDSNSEIISYFEKFKDNQNYDRLFERFDDLTKIRMKGLIELNEYKIPNIGPSDDLENFPEMLKDWKSEDIEEVKNIIKLYDTGNIESIEEAIILIEILKNNSDNYPDILDKILKDLQNQKFDNIEEYDQLLNFSVDCNDSIIYNGLWNYFVTLLS